MTRESTPADSQSDGRSAPVRIGRIVSSHSHLDYVVEVFGDRDCEHPPEPHEREFGQPVYVDTDIDGTRRAVVGVIYDTQLVDPDQGRTGPRLSGDDQPQFTPAYVEERTTLAGVAMLGTARLTDDGTIAEPSHRMPRWTMAVDDTVYRCPDAMTAAFHRVEDEVRLAYVDRLLDVAGDLGAEVVLAVIDRLRGLVDDQSRRVLDVVEEQVAWQASERRGVV
ncbi:MAG: hypothetical protein ABEJ86_03435 [Halococcoides sp.]